jgi:5,10-methylenetetrahydromethanopterin reductase
MSKKVRFGLAFQASQPFPHYIKCLKLAQKYGFQMFQVYDDLLFKPAWPILFSVAPYLTRTSKTLLGAGVVNPFHSHPSIIATNLATLNEETNGRSFLVIGRGAFHELFGIKTVRPITAVKESIDIIQNLLLGRNVDYRGTVFSSTRQAQFRWSLRRVKTLPEIWIGTWGKKLAEIAGSMSQVKGIMISSITDPNYIEMLRERVAAGARSVGRDSSKIEIGDVIGTIVSQDRDKAFELAREASAVYLPYLSPMTEFVGVTSEEIEGVMRALSKNDLHLASLRVSEKSVNAFKMWGTPNDVIEKTSKLLDHGVTTLNYGFGRGPEDIEGIELLGKKVLPYFQNRK